MQFEVSEEDTRKIDKWLVETVFPAVIATQKEKIKEGDPFYGPYKSGWDAGIPYAGTIGGGLTYHFTPNGIGTSFTVSYSEHKLDLTNYDNW